MNSNPKLSYAIAAILGGSAMGLHMSPARAAADAAATDSEAIQEITVTAQRRSESLQNVPITIQAMTGDQLKQLNVSTLDDLLRYTPNVTFSGNGPGTGNIFMRGLSTGGSGNQSQSTTQPMPNVALYLDDQSMQFPARNNNVYFVDMERVEVLEGPQGTLFGGGAQAGAIRYITNKPKLDVTEGDANAGYGITAHGDPNSNANAVLNLPLIPDTLAVRAVIFNDHRGGYIDNVFGTQQFTHKGTPSAVASNSSLVADNTNTIDTNGLRLSLLYKINENWDFLLQQNYQNMEADGYFAQYPVSSDGVTPLQPLQITAFEPAYSKDKYESTAWTLNGNVPDILKAVYTGSYMVRHIEGQNDYSGYMVSPGGIYYGCTGAGSGMNSASTKPQTCYAPVGGWNDTVRNTHQSHELRFTSPDEYRIRGLLGFYYEQFKIYDDMNFNYLTIPQCSPENLAIAAGGGPDCLSAVGPTIPGYFANDPTLRLNSNTAFGEDVERGYNQGAAFTSIDFDILPKVLTITAGTRYFHYDEFEKGQEYYTTTHAVDVADGACVAAGHCGFGMNLSKTETGWRSRGNVTWHITPDMMLYYTYSQGFRPGGFNRTSSNPDGSGIGLAAEAPYSAGGSDKQYLKPVGYKSDNLINNEIGFKSQFFEHRLVVNASIYKMDWENVQLSLFDPVHLGNTTFAVNGPTYEIKGAELQLTARVMEGLTFEGSSSWNSSSQTNAPCLTSVGVTPSTPTNPTPAGQCITQVNGITYTNPYGVLGTSPPFSPSVQFNARLRYDWHMGDYRPFAMVGANHVGSMRNEPASFPDGNTSSYCTPIPTTTLCQFTMPGYTTYDASLGVSKDQWTAQVIGNNLGDSAASQNTGTYQFIKSEVPIRPRVLMLQIGYHF
jgi:iron complex outermembrane recepter protein